MKINNGCSLLFSAKKIKKCECQLPADTKNTCISNNLSYIAVIHNMEDALILLGYKFDDDKVIYPKPRYFKDIKI